MDDNQRRPRPKWLQTLAAGLVERLEERRMTVTQSGAEAVLAERVAVLMAALHISERTARTYIDEDALDGLADNIVESFAAEEPGADLMALPRDGALRIVGIGRLIAALAQCADFFAAHADEDEELSRSRGTEIAGLLSVLGLILASHEGGDTVFAPRALFVRISRMLQDVAELITDEDVRLALQSDAIIAKAGSKAHRWPPPVL